jgi:penicillin-binding protein 1B
VDDEPITLTVGGKPWSPRNYDDRYEGRVSVRRALELSLNGATVRIAQAAGLDAVVQTARSLGLRGQLQAVPALALGAFEVTPLELARAYAPFASGGTRPGRPHGIHAVDDGSRVLVPEQDEEPERVISPAEAYLMTSLLQGVIASGTASSAASLLGRAPVAGKTGTTNEARDAWFVGYTPRLVVLVWVGFDETDAHGLSGAQAALPIWTDFMSQAVDAYPQGSFEVPEGIVQVDIDATNGKKAGRYCPVVAREVFLAGSEPEVCDEHRNVVDEVVRWWQRMWDLRPWR